MPAIDATTTMRPHFAAIMPGMTARQAMKVPIRLTSMTRLASARSICQAGTVVPVMPAAAIRTLTGPSSFVAAATAARIDGSSTTSAP